jgi:outer membrane lipoprotein SlyB
MSSTEHIDLPLHSQRRRSHDRFLVGLVGGALLVASLAAAGGWLLRDRVAVRETAAVPVAAMAPADDTRTNAAPVLPAARNEPAQPQPLVAKPAPVESAREPLPTRRVVACAGCGTVEAVRSVQHKGEANGVGAVAGGVLGGVIGNQVGGGNGRKAMTVLGAIGGGLAGHEVEKRVRTETVYEVRVRLDDGGMRTITQKTAPAPGSRVVVEGSTLRGVSARDETPRRVRTSDAYNG